MPKQKSNNVEKPSEKIGEMILEAISSDDDIAMDSEEDGNLVFYIFIFNLQLVIMIVF